jgi:hypothetical protein
LTQPTGAFRFRDDAGGAADYSCFQVTVKAEPPDVNAEGTALATPAEVSMVSASFRQAVSPIGPMTPLTVASQPKKLTVRKSASGSTLLSDGASMTHSADDRDGDWIC